MKKGALAIRYAQALFDAAKEHQATAEIYDELNILSSELETNPGFRQLIMDRSIGAQHKKDFIESTLGKHISPLTRNFLYIIFDKNREYLIQEATAAFNDLWQDQQGIIPAQLVTAKSINAETEGQLVAALKKAFAKEVVFEHAVDPSLLGGAVVNIGDFTIDGSLKGRLRHMREELTK
ncbi:MAG: ATP synthase F1 subunit delta, partial [Firmicutes bacterium]|nr:ATP synthase F1 subunit delta [Bacillota bacterium]